MERIPLPQPMSSTVAPGVTTFSRVSRHRRVVGCDPVPKARPGSMCSTLRPSVGSASSQVGRISSLSPTGMG